MSTDLLADWWVHPLSIERFLGVDGYGRKRYAPVDDPLPLGWIDDKRRLVRAADGTEVVSETTIFLPIATDAVPADSRVTLSATHGGRTSTVVAVSVHHGGGLDTPDHIELALA